MWRDDPEFETLASERKRLSSQSVKRPGLEECLDALGSLAPKGFSAGLHIRFASPMIYVRTYESAWTKIYDENAYALRDPLVFWGLGVKGHTRWSAIKLPDPFNIMGQARAFGLNFGAVVSHGPITSRSIVGFAREDREFTDAEIADAYTHCTRRPSPRRNLRALRLRRCVCWLVGTGILPPRRNSAFRKAPSRRGFSRRASGWGRERRRRR